MNDIYQTIFETIDMRSFSNLWYWLAIVVFWSTASHWVMGVPFDMIRRARSLGGEAEEDLRDLVRVHVKRLMLIVETSGVWVVASTCFIHTVLVILGFVYGIEFAQAVFLLLLPMSLIFALSIRTARRIRAADGEGLHRMLLVHRRIVQGIGVVSILVTSFWGMFQNLALGPI